MWLEKQSSSFILSFHDVVLLRLRVIKEKKSNCDDLMLSAVLVIDISNDTVWSTKIIGNHCEWLLINYEYLSLLGVSGYAKERSYVCVAVHQSL